MSVLNKDNFLFYTYGIVIYQLGLSTMKSRSLTGAVLLLLILILTYYVTVYSMKVPSNHYCRNQLTPTNCPPDATRIVARENKSTMNHDPTNSPGLSGGSESTDRFHLSLAYLSLKEREQFDNCAHSGKTITLNAPLDNGTCHFMNGTGRRPVALASFPGSGNTWVRGLLEKVTGICTGELALRATIMPLQTNLSSSAHMYFEAVHFLSMHVQYRTMAC